MTTPTSVRTPAEMVLKPPNALNPVESNVKLRLALT